MNPQTRSNIIAIVAILTILFFMGLYISEKRARKEAETISEELISNKIKELADQKKTASDSILSLNDSVKVLIRVNELTEKKRKSNSIYYQNEIKKLNSITTFHARNKYNDSLTTYLSR